MNVTFHMLSAVATAAILSSRQNNRTSHRCVPPNLSVVAAGFVVGVFAHGLLDYAPHSYPIKPIADVSISLALLGTAMTLANPRCRLLLGACSLGSVFPDLVDLAPAIVNKRLGWSLPVVKLFPWHWRQYSGSIYDGSRKLDSLLCHILVIAASFILLCVFRRSFLAQKHDR
jgi:hypothetical protein